MDNITETENLEVIALLEPFKEKITSANAWDAFVKEHDEKLPSARVLIYKFGSWNNVKKELGIKNKREKYSEPYSKEELKEIALKHKGYMLSKRTWDEYATLHELPSAQTFINAFEKWSEIKGFVGIQTELKKPSTYTKGQLKEILKKHGKNYESRYQWDVYAKENKLPKYQTLRKHFTYEEILKIVKKPKSLKGTLVTKEDLIEVALKHKDVFFTSMAKWDVYAEENKLPKSNTFHKKFGTWKKAKIAVTKAQLTK